MPDSSTHQPNIILLFGLVWLAVALQLLWLDWAYTAQVLGDTDDAMRLVEVREFIAGRGWFDLHEPRLQPPDGYDTHWSRLIDAGLAGLYFIFQIFTDAALAERLMRVVWPPLWLALAMAGALALSWRLGGRVAALVGLLLMIIAMPAYLQFKPGRIDHHNVQITLAVLTTAAAIWSDRAPWTAWAAGALSGLAIAIGFESMPFIVLAGGIFAARYILDRTQGILLARYGYSAAASTALFFLISVSPSHWKATACDAIAMNSAAPAFFVAMSMAIVGSYFADQRRVARSMAIIVIVGFGVAFFILLEPVCLRGPFAMVASETRSAWLSHVKEIQSLATVIRIDPVAGIGFAFYPLAAFACAVALYRKAQLRSDSGFVAAFAALLIAIAITLSAVRAVQYAIWFSMPFIAALMVGLFTRLKLTTLSSRMLAIIPFLPIAIAWISVTVIKTINPAESIDGDIDPCIATKNYAVIAKLPAGVIVTNVDYGPFVLALTPHSVVAAPYHRLSYGIVASDRVFTARPDEALKSLHQVNATYVMTCGSRPPSPGLETDNQHGLWIQLKGGNVPNWLELVPDTGLFNVYRLKR